MEENTTRSTKITIDCHATTRSIGCNDANVLHEMCQVFIPYKCLGRYICIIVCIRKVEMYCMHVLETSKKY